MKLKDPIHPGVIVKHDCVEALGLSVTQAAKVLGVTRQTLSRLLNAQVSMSMDMAIRVAKAFGSTPEHWLRMQLAYDVAHMEERMREIDVARYQA